MSAQNPGWFRRLFRAIGQGFSLLRNTVLNLLFLLLLVGFVSVLLTDDKIKIADSTALVLNLRGDLVEEKRWVDPFEAAIQEGTGGEEEQPEILVRDVVKVIERAAKDPKIKVMVLELSQLGGGSLDKLTAVGVALDKFKQANKQIFATGAFFGQNQYFLASYADSINLNPNGAVLLEGYGSYPMYYKSALEKLKISTHVFKVGTYKSAVEPYLRDDMSPEAKEANSAWLNEIWSSYKQQVAQRRGFAIDNFDETFAALYQKISAADGNMTQYALTAKLVDTVQSRQQFRDQMIALVGEDKEEHTFSQISFKEYASLVLPKHRVDNPLTDKVAIVVARGMIVDGSVKAGMIGGDSTSKLLREARLNDKVKAVVLRIDSGGGSAFASDLIADEINLLKAAGKPVIASMGAVAASGGYWIAAPANEIWAAPTTITGSIGIFALFHTAEQAMGNLGLNMDGVGTTELAGFSNGVPLFKGISPDAEKLLQRLIDRGYDDFISHVGAARQLEKSRVNEIGQGRVWTGTKALEFGLVDKLGSFEDAIAAAAQKAGLSQYDIQIIEQKLTPQQELMRNLFAKAQTSGWLPALSSPPSALGKLVKQLDQQISVLSQFNDPNGMYSFCFSCQVQ